MDYALDKIKLSEEDFKRIIGFIQKKRGIDLSPYRQSFLFRRLRLRMLVAKTRNSLDYLRLLEEKPEEYNLFLDNLAINVTEFFRDPAVFVAFKRIVLPEIMRKKQRLLQPVIRVWSAGCASGEEPYSIAILIKDALKDEPDFSVSIWGTDIDKSALEKARKAQYSIRDLKKVNLDILKRYFDSTGNNSYQLKDQIRQMVKFMRRSLIEESPLKFIDIIFCRNVLIYLTPQEQKILFNKFNQALNAKGYLVVGKVETIWERNTFVPVDIHNKIYQKVN